ncbi:hypothetical protein A2685_01180 [Candidatus Woesebacteria bacterium RIFCSPHIGHO2_01_FULL_37_10]|uniref:ATP synthase subunit b n=1 Tax=Candidatus Woesebacteria bacterium RIFCSPHIGHO2_01_FULL_37_10 TaxID=1802489 RepID=A0A1F7XT23_9BACT|nr:MAG: hypothetical protein A2685_01180 [Candidatus Woesebacteria bacterium RIFCSPHIGHO2_01_FULL_37_10]
MIESSLFYITVVVVVALILLLIAMVLLYIRLVEKFTRFEKDKKDQPAPLVGEEMQKAVLQAQNIINDAGAKAAEIIRHTQVFTQTQTSALATESQKLSQEFLNSFNEMTKNVSATTRKILETVPEGIKGALTSEVSSIKNALLQELTKARDDARQTIESAYQQASQEVNNYKNVRLNQVDENIIDILQEVSKEVLGREINQEEHEKLVLRALEEAKAHHMFSSGEEVNDNNSQPVKAESAVPQPK